MAHNKMKMSRATSTPSSTSSSYQLEQQRGQAFNAYKNQQPGTLPPVVAVSSPTQSYRRSSTTKCLAITNIVFGSLSLMSWGVFCGVVGALMGCRALHLYDREDRKSQRRSWSCAVGALPVAVAGFLLAICMYIFVFIALIEWQEEKHLCRTGKQHG